MIQCSFTRASQTHVHTFTCTVSRLSLFIIKCFFYNKKYFQYLFVELRIVIMLQVGSRVADRIYDIAR